MYLPTRGPQLVARLTWHINWILKKKKKNHHVACRLQRAAVPERGIALGKAAAQLVDGTGMGREYNVMGMRGGVSKGTEGLWPFVMREV